MKTTILVGCVALGLAGCATERGGVGTYSESEYGSGWGMGPSYAMHDSIYPVWRQPSITGNDMGSVRPMLDPSREYDLGYWRREAPPETVVVEREYPPRATAPRDPFVR